MIKTSGEGHLCTLAFCALPQKPRSGKLLSTEWALAPGWPWQETAKYRGVAPPYPPVPPYFLPSFWALLPL